MDNNSEFGAQLSEGASVTLEQFSTGERFVVRVTEAQLRSLVVPARRLVAMLGIDYPTAAERVLQNIITHGMKSGFKGFKKQYGDAWRDADFAERRCWNGMRQRCNNKKMRNYPYYGGRGIRVCSRWDSFEAFLRDMGPKPSPRHTLDRIDPNGNYEPGNCRWATWSEQAVNKRGSHRLVIDGKTTTARDAAAAHGFHVNTVRRRLRERGAGPDLFTRFVRHLSKTEVGCIKWRLLCGEKRSSIAKDFGITVQAVGRMDRGQMYPRVLPCI